VVGAGVVELALEQPAEVGADRGVGGGQGRRGRQPGRAEQGPDRGPLPGGPDDAGVFGRRVVRAQLVQREPPRVDRGQQVRVEGAEEPGAFGRA
jgi:hypothetical protein